MNKLNKIKWYYCMGTIPHFNISFSIKNSESQYHSHISRLEPNCWYSYFSSSCSLSEIVAKSLPPPQNLCRPLKTFACGSLRYRKRWGWGGGVTIVVEVCGEMCGKIEKLSDWNKNWCGNRYWPRDYDSGDKKTKKPKDKKDKKDNNKKRQKRQQQKGQKDKRTKRTKNTKTVGPKGPHALCRS